MQHVGKSLSCFTSCATNVMAERKPLEQCNYVSGLDNLQMLVRSIAFEATDGLRGVEDSNTMRLAKINYFFVFKPFIRSAEMLLVSKENLPHDSPHIVLRIRIKKIHTPAFLRRRKTAQHQQSCFLRKKRLQRMTFYI